jgi:predicted dehydrogenase
MIEEELKLEPDKRMEVISILTPNFLHYPMAKKLLENNFNVICEKPMTTSYEEAKELDRINKEKQLVFAVTYTYTGYPMVRQMKNMIESGEIGDILHLPNHWITCISIGNSKNQLFLFINPI